MSEDQWNAFKQYQSQLRQSQAERTQRISEIQQQKENESRQQEIIREQTRREIEQRLIVQQQLSVRQANETRIQDESNHMAVLAQSAGAIRLTNQQRQIAQAVALQKIKEAQKGKTWESCDGRIFMSPLERDFWNEWLADLERVENMPLVPQYPVGRFRVDFAHLASLTIVELDGHEFHSSRRNRTRDAQRERTIQVQGWHIVRFTGSEVYADPANCAQQVVAIIEQRTTEAR